MTSASLRCNLHTCANTLMTGSRRPILPSDHRAISRLAFRNFLIAGLVGVPFWISETLWDCQSCGIFGVSRRDASFVPIHKWPIRPISVSRSNDYPMITKQVPALIVLARLDLDPIGLFLAGRYSENVAIVTCCQSCAVSWLLPRFWHLTKTTPSDKKPMRKGAFGLKRESR